jgi:hypothetical protein
VRLPALPPQYGAWRRTSIGGISSTVRRSGLLRSRSTTSRPGRLPPVTLFAVRASSASAVREALAQEEGVTVGRGEKDEEYGHVTEVVVHDGARVGRVAARVARAGAVPVMDGAAGGFVREVGVERLDRVSAKVVTDESMVGNEDGVFGLRRGSENWLFPWLPDGWEPPITWDHMVRNAAGADVASLPQPLRQHVARDRLGAGDYPPVGSRWVPVGRPDVPSAEAIAWAAEHGPEEEVPFHVYHRVVSLPAEADEAIAFGDEVQGLRVSATAVAKVGEAWYRPVDTRRALERHIPKGPHGPRRYVAAHLTEAQSKQLIEAFFYLVVEGGGDPLLDRACALVLLAYLRERGYTARWMGKYEQDARHVGNGDSFRRFARLTQYAPHRLPTPVLNRLCDVEGKLVHRGSKGSRSKYRKERRERYAPMQRMTRTEEDERRMLHG